jgi:hypothetical protein
MAQPVERGSDGRPQNNGAGEIKQKSGRVFQGC